jgi:hypothetical protein
MIILQATELWQGYHRLHSKKKYTQDLQSDFYQV